MTNTVWRIHISFMIYGVQNTVCYFDINRKNVFQLGEISLDRYHMVIRAISMLDSDVITLLSNDVPTIKADLAEPLQQLEVIIEVI